MKLKLLLFFLVNFCFTEMYAQIQKVGLAVDLSNGNQKCVPMGRFFNLTTASIGIDIKKNKSNFQILGSYGYNTYILLPLGFDHVNYEKSHSLQSHFIGTTFECYFLNEGKKIRPYINLSLLTEFESNYENGFIDYTVFIPLKFNSPPLSANNSAVYYGNYPSETMYGGSFYKSTPILFTMNGGISLRIVENFRVNLSAGYSLSVLNYKNVKWTEYDDFNEMMDRSPMQKKALHSIAGQIGLNYVFDFKKKSKTETP